MHVEPGRLEMSREIFRGRKREEEWLETLKKDEYRVLRDGFDEQEWKGEYLNYFPKLYPMYALNL